MLVTTYRLQAARRSAGANGKVQEGYENAAAAFRTIANEGLLNFYAGYQSAAIGSGYSNAVYYYLYQGLNELMTTLTMHKPLHLIDNIIVAALAGAATSAASNPIWVINTRMSVDSKKGKNESLLQTMLTIIREEGVGALFAGVLPALMLVLNPVINYVLFERICLALKSKKLSALQIFLVSCFTKLVAAFVTHPLLVVKTRMQANQTASMTTGQILVDMIKNEGLPGLFSGLSTKLVHSVLSSALLFLIKEETTAISIQFLVFLGLIKLAPKSATPA